MREVEGRIRELLQHRIHPLRTRSAAVIVPDEGFDFLSGGGDELDWPGEDERDLVGQGDIIVVHGGHGQGLAVLTDREDLVLASQALGDEFANRERDPLAAPDRVFLPGTLCTKSSGGLPLPPAGVGTRLVQGARRLEILIFHRRILDGSSLAEHGDAAAARLLERPSTSV